jgi:LAO/AO transport system kinase
MDLVTELKQGKRRAIARAISIVENNEKEARSLIKKIYKGSGKSLTIGITGPAGAGKSTLINKISMHLNKLGYKTAVLAIDPTSHITGGAILGDRVRMTESTDSGTYIRSMASRGATGAIALALRNSIRILEFAGFDPIIIESVGAGQTEIDIAKVVDITVVVYNPNTGDNIQTIKAGLTEIGDIYLINKSDLPGANQLFDSVRDFIGMSERNPIVMMTSTKSNKGIADLAEKLQELIEARRKTKKLKEQSRLDA